MLPGSPLAVAVSGSRSPSAGALVALSGILADLPPIVLVGDAPGIDAAVRRNVARAKVFRASGRGAPALVARSVEMARALSRSARPLLIALPCRPCPDRVAPAPRWISGGGSGTWATVALSLGLGVPALVWAPAVPAWDGWPLASRLPGGWWHVRP